MSETIEEVKAALEKYKQLLIEKEQEFGALYAKASNVEDDRNAWREVALNLSKRK